MPPGNDDSRRESVAEEPALIVDPQRVAEAEIANGLRQFDIAKSLVLDALERGSFRLRASMVLTLHREALAGISGAAGAFRPLGVRIEKSEHQPPPAHLVPGLVEELCDYINDNWGHTALHLAAYSMWRLNWIHPFTDGNGRTSRIVSYLVLSIRAGFVLPGSPSIPDQIVSDRRGYFKALEMADAADKAGRVDVSAMEALLGSMLATQLMGAYKSAGGTVPG